MNPIINFIIYFIIIQIVLKKTYLYFIINFYYSYKKLCNFNLLKTNLIYFIYLFYIIKICSLNKNIY